MENLFAYGTLMCADIMLEIAGVCPPAMPGVLRGYCRRSVRDEHYPAIMPHETGLVEGVIYLGVPDPVWERLDRFEGDMYTRRPVKIDMKTGATLPAAAYVLQPKYTDCLDPTDWDFTGFLLNAKADFQKQHQGYRFL